MADIDPSSLTEQDLVAALSGAEWLQVLSTREVDGEQVPVGSAVQVCPWCVTALPLDGDDLPFRQMHIDYHVDMFRIIDATRGRSDDGL